MKQLKMLRDMLRHKYVLKVMQNKVNNQEGKGKGPVQNILNGNITNDIYIFQLNLF